MIPGTPERSEAISVKMRWQPPDWRVDDAALVDETTACRDEAYLTVIDLDFVDAEESEMTEISRWRDKRRFGCCRKSRTAGKEAKPEEWVSRNLGSVQEVDKESRGW